MSTKSTLSWNMPDFPKDSPNIDKVAETNRDPTCPYYCLYEEAFEEDGSVYLEMRNCEFEATQDGVTVKIPSGLSQQLLECVTLEALRPNSATNANVNEQRRLEASAAFDSIDGLDKLGRMVAPAVVAPGEKGRLGHFGKRSSGFFVRSMAFLTLSCSRF